MARSVKVPDRFWTSLRIFVVPIVGVTTVVLALLLAERASLYGPLYTAAEILAEVAALVILTVLFLGATEARSLEISSDGISFRRLWQSVDLTWDALEPNFTTATPGRLPVSFHSIHSRALGPTILLSKDQARALLTYPAAPHWTVPASLRRAWGLDPGTT